jgi:hypothetical protein
MLGQLVTEPEQAPENHPLAKISLISKRTQGVLVSDIKLIRTDTSRPSIFKL